MSAFDDMMAEFAPTLQEHTGESAVLTPQGGDPVDITLCYVERAPLAPRGTDAGARMDYQIVVGITRQDLPTLTLNGDTVAIFRRQTDKARATMKISKLLGQEGGIWRVGLQ